MKLSVAIPTSDMLDKNYFFRRCLDSLWNQSFQDFEIVITDNSEDDEIERICEWYRTGISYYKNPIKGMAQNTNEAIRRSRGELIKILYMDDALLGDGALEKIVKKFKDAEVNWVVSGCNHTINGEDFFKPHIPHWSINDLYGCKNVIGSPSVLTFRNDSPLLFDENMTWLLDVEYYIRLYERYGEPTILKDIGVMIGLHDGQMTRIIPDELKLFESKYLMQKYGQRI